MTSSFTFSVWRLASRRLPRPFSEILTILDCLAMSVSPRAEPTVTTTLRVFGFLRAVIAMILWPRSFSVTVIRNLSLQVAPVAPVQDTRTLAVVPLTLAWPTDVWPLPGGGGGGVAGICTVASGPAKVPKSLVATAR